MAVKPIASVPADLTFLLPETVAKPIVIGDTAYNLYPLTEGEFETLSLEVSKLFNTVFLKGEMSPIDYLMQKDVLVNILSVALKPLSPEDIRTKLTAKQMMYASSVLWQLNFVTDDFNAETKENFQRVLGWVGLGAAAATAPQPTETKAKE